MSLLKRGIKVLLACRVHYLEVEYDGALGCLFCVRQERVEGDGGGVIF